jgi:hypothetical protein
MACIQELTLIAPLLSERIGSEFPDRLVPFFRAISMGRYNKFAEDQQIWSDLHSRTLALHDVHQTASEFFKSLPKKRQRREGQPREVTAGSPQEVIEREPREVEASASALRVGVSHVREKERARASRLLVQFERLLKRREIRALSATDVHGTALFTERPLKLSIPPDQTATLAVSLLRRAPGRLLSQGEWPQLVKFANHALNPGITWAYSAPSSIGMRVCGYSLQGSFRIIEPQQDSDAQVAIENDRATLRIHVERPAIVLRAVAYVSAGIVRGVALPRGLTHAEFAEDEIGKALDSLSRSVLAPTELD